MNTRVLAIVGSDRSGSTLLDNMLGGVPGAFSAGEIRYMWERGFAEGRLCGCGRKIVDCDVWSKVIERLPPDAKDVGRMLEDVCPELTPQKRHIERSPVERHDQLELRQVLR